MFTPFAALRARTWHPSFLLGQSTGTPVRGAFTLLEVILALSLVALLAGLAVGVFAGSLEEAEIEASADRIVSLLRSTRAEAALTGRRFRLTFEAETLRPVVTIERDALGEPEVFTPYKAWWIDRAGPVAGVNVVLCERTGAADLDEAADSPQDSESDKPESLGEITFRTDGSSDSARIVLAGDDEEHPWAVEITLNGIDGTITVREIDAEEEGIEQ